MPDWLRSGSSLISVNLALPTSGSPAAPAGQIPADIRRAVQGGRTGWQRLRRFQIAMTHPTIAAAAARLRICPSALSHQLQAAGQLLATAREQATEETTNRRETRQDRSSTQLQATSNLRTYTNVGSRRGRPIRRKDVLDLSFRTFR